MTLREKVGHSVASNMKRQLLQCNPQFAYLTGQYTNERYFWTSILFHSIS